MKGMATEECWGFQFGGIPAAAILDSDFAVEWTLKQVSSDYLDRIVDFMRRHGGPSEQSSVSSEMDGGYRGFHEVRAADGYVLRMEWSRNELRGTLCIVERHSLQNPEKPVDAVRRKRFGNT